LAAATAATVAAFWLLLAMVVLAGDCCRPAV